MSFQSNITNKQIIAYLNTSAAYMPIVIKVGYSLRCMRHIERVAGKVRHIVFKSIVINIYVGMCVGLIGNIRICLKVWRHDMNGTSHRSYILNKSVIFDNDRTFVCLNH